VRSVAVAIAAVVSLVGLVGLVALVVGLAWSRRATDLTATAPATPTSAAIPAVTTSAATIAPTAIETTAVTVEVRSAPAGAAILVGGKRVGVTPARLALDLPVAIVVTRAGYQAARVRAEHAGPIDVRLIPARRPRRHRPAAGETLD